MSRSCVYIIVCVYVCIRECGSTLYVELTSTVQMLIQKSTGMVPDILKILF